MSSGSDSGIVYYMANGNQVDYQDNTIDQMPFYLAFVGDRPIASGCLIQHGDWLDRTTSPPPEFWGLVNASGLNNDFLLSDMPTEPAGRITDLKINSQNEAFGKLVEVLKDHMNE
jgi:hypothetical protein